MIQLLLLIVCFLFLVFGLCYIMYRAWKKKTFNTWINGFTIFFIIILVLGIILLFR